MAPTYNLPFDRALRSATIAQFVAIVFVAVPGAMLAVTFYCCSIGAFDRLVGAVVGVAGIAFWTWMKPPYVAMIHQLYQPIVAFSMLRNRCWWAVLVATCIYVALSDGSGTLIDAFARVAWGVAIAPIFSAIAVYVSRLLYRDDDTFAEDAGARSVRRARNTALRPPVG